MNPQWMDGPSWHPCNRLTLNCAVRPRPRRHRCALTATPRREADRHLQVHRLQGLPGRVHAVERPGPTTSAAASGVYDNPVDLTDQSWTVMRFAEIDRPGGNLGG